MENEASRLLFLARVVRKESEHLSDTANRLFGDRPVTIESVTQWVQDPLTAERLDAFVARFGRLQDTVGDKLLPRLLTFRVFRPRII